jgi:hypothetical protein
MPGDQTPVWQEIADSIALDTDSDIFLYHAPINRPLDALSLF